MNFCPFCGSKNIRDRAVIHQHLPSDLYYACNGCGLEWSNRPSIEYLTELEMICLDYLRKAASAGLQIANTASGIGYYWDGIEWAQRIHACQHMIMAQAASRAYPDTYRLLGEVPRNV